MTKEEAIKIINCYDIGFYDLSGKKIPADKLVDAFDMAIEALEQSQWIPCEERLPEYGKEVIICLQDGGISVGWSTGYSWYADYSDTEVFNVVAWMPLPEPWKGEDE